MGLDKASLEVDGRPLAEFIAQRLLVGCNPVTVLGRAPIAGFDFIGDEGEYEGPLVALSRFAPIRDWIFVASCDLAAFDARVPRFLLSRAGSSRAVVPMIAGRLQPLCALYPKYALETALQLVAHGKKSMMALIDSIAYTVIDEASFENGGIEPKSVLGANTLDELRKLS
jgi:molybdopterin-guanine dinucleotide biosynthesis protein A